MKLRIDNRDLYRALSAIGGATRDGAKGTPSAAVFLDCSGDKLTIDAHTFSAAARVELPTAQIGEGGAALVPWRVLHKICASLPVKAGVMVELASSWSEGTGYRLKVSCGRAVFDASCMDPSQFVPAEFPDHLRASDFRIPVDLLRLVLDTCGPFVTWDSKMEALQHVQVEVTGGSLVAVGLDNAQLCRYGSPCEMLDQSFRLHDSTIKILRDAIDLSDDSVKSAVLIAGERDVFVQIGRMTVVGRVSEAKFPSWERIVPPRVSCPVRVARPELEAALRRSALISNDGCVRLTATNAGLTVYGSTKYGEVSAETVDVFSEGEFAASDFVCDSSRLSKALSTFDCALVDLHISAESSAAMLIVSESEPGLFHVLMPINPDFAPSGVSNGR